MITIEHIKDTIILNNLDKLKDFLSLTCIKYNLNDLIDLQGNNALHFYIKQSDRLNYSPEKIIESLLNAGLKIDQPQKRLKKYTPLHVAVLKGSFPICKLLLEKGAQVDVIDYNGNTPLLKAIINYRGKDRSIITLLLDYNADIYKENFFEVSPMKLSKTISNYDFSWFHDIVNK